MKTRLIIGVLLIFFIVVSFSGLVSAQGEGVPYVPPPVPPVEPPYVTPPVEVPPMPPTAGGMLQAYGMLIGLLLLGSALPLRRR